MLPTNFTARMMIARGASILLLMCLSLTGLAETVYIDDKVMVGLHQDNDIDSPIIKTLASGTALEVIKYDSLLTQVTEPGGSSGWIDNHYLTEVAPGRTQLQLLQEKAGKLEAELTALKSNTVNPPDADSQKLAALRKENEDLKQQLHSEQLKSGELQAQAAELRNQLSRTGAAEVTTAEEETADSGETPAAVTTLEGIYGSLGTGDWRAVLMGMAVCLVIGLLAGAYFMDWMSRRRHGGFRI